MLPWKGRRYIYVDGEAPGRKSPPPKKEDPQRLKPEMIRLNGAAEAAP